MKKLLIWAGAAVGVIVLLIAAVAVVFWRAEIAYQKSASAKRVNDTHKIAELLEAYQTKTGRLPLDHHIPPDGGALTIIIGTPEAERMQQQNGNVFGPEMPELRSRELLAALRAELGPTTTLPVDPQIAPTGGAPNAYYVRFRANGQYIVAGFLRRAYAPSLQLMPDIYAYALKSKEGDWGPIWNKARELSDVPKDERESIRIAGEAEDRRFGQWVEEGNN